MAHRPDGGTGDALTSAIVLPPREMFSAQGTGAIGLLVRLLARMGGAVVYGMPTPVPFNDVTFQPVPLKLLPVRQAMRYAAGLASTLRRAAPDMIEVHNRPDIALYLARRFPRVPVVLFLHNDPQGMRGARTRRQRATLVKQLAAVAPVSAYLQHRLLDGREPPGNVRVFPNFVDLSAMPPRSPENLILFAGRVVADKGADSFVAACGLALPQLPGWRAEMIGADRFGADSPETPFLQTLRPRAASSRVAMLGWKPHAEVLAAMTHAAIVVVPSRWPEPFGLTALEAMACGAALICAPRGGLPEVMGQVAVPIDPDDPTDIARAMLSLAQDPPRRAAIAAGGLARAAEFSAEAAKIRLADLRRAVLSTWSQTKGHPI
jgi:UDP-glucose:(glucosyl)LPS alpha-1,2-glucosyltransferase